MGFRFYISDTFDGKVVGTNEESVAVAFAQTEEAFVVDTQTGEWLSLQDNDAGYERIAVEEQPTYKLADDKNQSTEG